MANELSVLFVLILIVFCVLFVTGLVVQYRTNRREIELRRSYILSKGPELYKSLNEGE